jgi:hypothetical protein
MNGRKYISFSFVYAFPTPTLHYNVIQLFIYYFHRVFSEFTSGVEYTFRLLTLVKLILLIYLKIYLL